MKRRQISIALTAALLVLLSGFGLVGAISVSGSALNQLDPTSQEQTIDAIVQTRLAQTAIQLIENQATRQAAATASALANNLNAQMTLAASATNGFSTLVNQQVATAAYETAQANVPNAVQHNADWTPVVQNFGGIDMVLVPAGCFQMGSNAAGLSENPITQICFQTPFWISRYEVSNQEFTQFGGQAAQTDQWTDPNQPRANITWFEAVDFAAQVDAQIGGGWHLPTEAEWEYAARGPDDLIYPWGNVFDPNKIASSTKPTAPADVGANAGDVSWVGAYDLAGSLSEWTSTGASTYPYATDDGREDTPAPGPQDAGRVLRGGVFLDGTQGGRQARASQRIWLSPKTSDAYTGFRLVREYHSGDARVAPIQPQPTAVPSSTPSVAMIQHNADWTPIHQTFNGIDMVLVPAGCFQMGSDDPRFARDVYPSSPVSQQCFDKPFWISRYEVTNAEFDRLGGKASADDTNPLTSARGDITWVEARDFAAQIGMRLPTEAEWEYAARGPDDLIYPWIDDSGQASSFGPVGQDPQDASWVGAEDMIGGMAEWTSSIYAAYPYSATDGRENLDDTSSERVTRGGAYIGSNALDPISRSEGFPQNQNGGLIGIRLVMDYQP